MTSTLSAGFRPDVEGLRGVAILTVVAYHCGLPWISGGFVGVDVFFVLSGYLITRLLVAEIERSGRLDVTQFYARRFRRLLPASALTLIVTLAIASVLFAPGELEFAARAGRASAVYLGNVFFAINAADYFAPKVDGNPLLHMWSLAVEEQFYLFWPLLITAALVWFRSRRALVAVMAALTALSLAACIWVTAQNGTAAFYLLPTRAWEFGAGGLCSLAFWLTPLPRRISILTGWIGLALLGVSLLLITSDAAFPGWLAVVPVVATCGMLLAGATTPKEGVSTLLSTRQLVWLGALSYSWYLWHWPFLVFAQVLFPHLTTIDKVAAALMALVCALGSYHFVENPLRHSSVFVSRPALSIAGGLALTAVCFLGAVQTRTFADALAERPAMKSFAAAAIDDGRLPRARCVASGTQSGVLQCEFGQRDAATHVVLFGDSHAFQWFNPIESIATQQHWRLTTVLKSGCGAADVTDGALARDAVQRSCVAWRRTAIQSIVAWRPDLVIMGTATNFPDANREQWRLVRDGLHASLRPLVDAGLHVAVMRDVPRFAFNAPDCLARAARHGWDVQRWCTGPIELVVKADVYVAEQEAARGLEGVGFVDTLPALCSHEECRTASGGRAMYRDDNHLTGTFAESLRPVIEPQLATILGGSSNR